MKIQAIFLADCIALLMVGALLVGCDGQTGQTEPEDPGVLVVTVDIPLVGERRVQFHAEAVVTAWRQGHAGSPSDGRVTLPVPESGIVEFDELDAGWWHVALVQPRIEGWGDQTAGWRGYPTNDTLVELGSEMVTVPRVADYSPVIGDAWRWWFDADEYLWRITTGVIDPYGAFTGGETEIRLSASDSVVAIGPASGTYDYPNIRMNLQIIGGCTATGTVEHSADSQILPYTKIEYTHIRIICPEADIDVQWP
ncbi:MAG: hypothetical protein OXI71_00785 [Gemmatimonadota bacterium]|nr:hypothetical protein [Gemmatimonadota bacterium]